MRTYRTGQTVILREELARSGQGVVYLTDRPGILAKLYSNADDVWRFEKLKVMAALPPADPTWETLKHLSIAWPLDLLLEDSRCIGFLMPHIQNARELTHVYNPVLRAQHSPKFNWFYLHSSAFNYVSALEAIHAGGYVVGDIKPQNILVDPRALIAIIDTDSFQVANPESGMKYRCPVGSEGFTPPELLRLVAGKKFTEVDRTEIHDRFGMAVIIYLLLFGRHPFTEGKWRGDGEPPAPDDRVLRGLWLHTPGGEIGSSPGTIPLTIIHPQLEQCFRRCFIDGHMEPLLRPSAAEWKHALKAALDDLSPCNTEPNHHFSRKAGLCHWCERREIFGIDIFSPKYRTPPKLPPSVRHQIEMLTRAPVGNRSSGTKFPWMLWLLAAPIVVIFLNLINHTNKPDAGLERQNSHTTFPTLIFASHMEPWSEAESKIPAATKASFKDQSTQINELIAAGGTRISEGYVYVLFYIFRAGTIAPTGAQAFLIVRYPQAYGKTGRETYVKVLPFTYAMDLGPDTKDIVNHMSSFEGNSTWTLVGIEPVDPP